MPIKAEFPSKLQCLFKPSRYKVLHGGRGGAKSWGIARALLIQASSKPLRIGCFREFQNSISESVHALLSDQIAALGLQDFYEIQNTAIYGRNGSEFHFAGLRHNITKIKSFEGLDIAWVEEAQTVSKTSWDTLIPTIRKDGSEIWISYNPELETDETHQRFVIHPPESAIVVKINWSDNPWFPEVLRAEKDHLRATDFDAYLHVWEGQCKQMLDGAVYAAELRKAAEEDRIRSVPHIAGKPVHTAWDLGHADSTCIWFYQFDGLGEVRIIDYAQDSQKKFSHYLQLIQSRGYVYGTHFLPHDADSETLAADKTIAGQARAAGLTVRVLPRSSVALGIDVARTVFDNCWFDATKCADGIQALRHYRYEIDPDTKQFSKNPLHDWASHGSDAFRYLAVSVREPKKAPRKPVEQPRVGGWMAA